MSRYTLLATTSTCGCPAVAEVANSGPPARTILSSSVPTGKRNSAVPHASRAQHNSFALAGGPLAAPPVRQLEPPTSSRLFARYTCRRARICSPRCLWSPHVRRLEHQLPLGPVPLGLLLGNPQRLLVQHLRRWQVHECQNRHWHLLSRTVGRWRLML